LHLSIVFSICFVGVKALNTNELASPFRSSKSPHANAIKSASAVLPAPFSPMIATKSSFRGSGVSSNQPLEFAISTLSITFARFFPFAGILPI